MLGSKTDVLIARMEPLENLIYFLASHIEQPVIYETAGTRGFRYKNPTKFHFCLLKAVKSISAMNACLELAEKNYISEISVLIRTIIECTTQIEFILASKTDSQRVEADKIVSDFFADLNRDDALLNYGLKKKQKDFHLTIGKRLDSEQPSKNREPANILYSRIYLAYSNYVHSKYPEIMDLYGGTPGHFHLCGMANTPKDLECEQVLETFIESLELVLRMLVLDFNLLKLIDTDPNLARWYHKHFEDLINQQSTERSSPSRG